ncbi:MAG: hypothetical protein ACLUQW_10475 [Collinsella sp.]
MDVILKNTIDVRCLNHIVTVPTPEAYAIHKMTINGERGKKAEKDAHAVENMLPLLDEEKFAIVFSSLPKKEKARVRAFGNPWRCRHILGILSRTLAGNMLGRVSCLVECGR